MIYVDFLTTPGGNLIGFRMAGHSGYVPEGEDDIVCAAVTSAALIFPALFCFRGLLDAYFPFVYAGILVLTAACFITNFRMKKFGMKGNVVMLIAGALLFAILLVLKFNGI